MYHLAKSLYQYATSKEEYSILLLGLDNAGKTTLLSQIKALFIPAADGQTQPVSAKTVPTVGQNVSTISLPDMYLKIWDIGGQISMRGLWQSYYSSCHAIVFVVDSADVGDDPDVSDLSPSSTPEDGAGADADADAEGDGNGDGHGDGDGGDGDDDGALEGQIKAIDPAGRFGRLDECRQVLESVLRHADTAGVPILVLANKQDREDCVEVVRIKEGFVRKVFEGQAGAGVRDSRVLPVSALMGTGVQEAVDWIRSRVKWNKEGRPPVMR
ncbi:ADP-ribosylation factor 6 [Arthroderma uncinatum]|uniref:ADP-ribosylation factor 6 n=1 Tax=Arthroderma uncinatum TaxID=74035 RepID=UPI00144AD17F|nr:ADP-ribosylation factor 6 [Arthroderma uncinatum]KAF3481049.1 ADP-ribosylation factor 6 [Arthroderma uncinatum]